MLSWPIQTNKTGAETASAGNSESFLPSELDLVVLVCLPLGERRPDQAESAAKDADASELGTRRHSKATACAFGRGGRSGSDH